MIILLDVDGVLVESRAYRLGLQQTVAYFGHRLGLGATPPTLSAADIEVYESQNITVEWESGAISVAALLLERWRAAPFTLSPPATLETVLATAAAHPINLPSVDFSAVARRVGALMSHQPRAAPAALSMFLKELTTYPPEAQVLVPCLHELLDNCASITQAPVTRVFQNFILGHRQYATTYGLPPLFTSEPLLETLDRPLVSPRIAQWLLDTQRSGQAQIALYTARPSLPPVEDASPQHSGYTPEAEMARHLVGLDSLPLIGAGKMAWLAQQSGQPLAGLLKPAPAHALAALAAAVSGHESAALQAALTLQISQRLVDPLTNCVGHSVHVFDDSSGGLTAVREAVALLERHSQPTPVKLHGIAAIGSPKYTALSKIADTVHADINLALQAIAEGKIEA